MAMLHVLSRSLKLVARGLYSLILGLFSFSCHYWFQLQRRVYQIMRSYRVAAKSRTSGLRIPVRFLGEIHIFLTSLIILGCIGVLIKIFISMHPDDTYTQTTHVSGLIFYLSLTILSSLVDIGLGILLIFAAKQNSIEKSLLWYRSSLSLLLFYTLISISFGVMLRSPLILLPLIPNFIFKPFALWVVNGYINDLQTISCQHLAEQRAMQTGGEEEMSDDWDGEGEVAGPSNRKRTTVFILHNDTNENNGNETNEQNVERRALILKSAKREPGPSSSVTTLRQETIAEE